jgi:hypothetical protein
VDRPEVVAIAAAPNWARTRFGLGETELDMRVLRGVLGCRHVGVSYVRFGPAWRMTVGHRHPGGGEEVYVLVEGSARIKVENVVLEMDAPSAIRVHGDSFRAIRAKGDTPAVFVVAGTIDGPSTTELARDFWPEDE